MAEFSTGWDAVLSLVYLGDAATAAGDFSEAKGNYLDALPQGMKAKATPLVMNILIGLAHLQTQDSKFEQAIKLANFVMHNSASTHEAKDRAAQLIHDSEYHLTNQQLQTICEWSNEQSTESIITELVGEEYLSPTVRIPWIPRSLWINQKE